MTSGLILSDPVLQRLDDLLVFVRMNGSEIKPKGAMDPMPYDGF
jgi:hypothetical protein